MPARGDLEALRDELGDLLFQVVFHARIAEERGAFTMADVATAIADKMERRHPHVVGDGGDGQPRLDVRRIAGAMPSSGVVVIVSVRKYGGVRHPLTHTTCFTVWTISTRSACAAITASIGL